MLNSSDISQQIHERVHLAIVVEEARVITDVNRYDGPVGVNFILVEADIVNL